MKEIINTPNAPAAIGPYSQAVSFGGLVFTSGQLPINPEIGEFPSDCIKDQTRQSLNNVKATLEAAGSCMEKVIKTTVFLQDMDDFGAMNEVYNTYFTKNSFPARSAVEVSALPRNAKVEIEVIAYK